MEEELTDEQAICKAVDMLKEKGIFDSIRKNCLEDINTKSSFLNLNQRIEGYVNNFLKEQLWDETLNKNQLRERLRKDINESVSIKSGITHLADQVIQPTNFENKIDEQIREILGIEEEFNDDSKDNSRDESKDYEKENSKDNVIKKENDLDRLSDDKFDDKNLVSDVSDDEDELFVEKANNERLNSNKHKVKLERELDFERNLDNFLNDKRKEDNLDTIKVEKYESSISSISSTEELDCMN